jgi:galactose mutarotase-like enzyme
MSVVTRSHKHITSDGSKIQVRVDTTCPSCNCFTGKFLAAFICFGLVSEFYSSILSTDGSMNLSKGGESEGKSSSEG